MAEILKKRKTTRAGDLRGYSWRNGAARAMRLFYFFVLFYSLVSRDSLLRLLASISLFHTVASLVAPTRAFCTAERRIGSLNKMTRLFIGAFVRVKVGIAFLFGRHPRISLCERISVGPRDLGKRRASVNWSPETRTTRSIFFLLHFRARIIVHSVTLADAGGIRAVYEVMSKPSRRRRR